MAYLLIAVSYFLLAKLGLFFSTETQVSIIWPATGIGIAAMVIFGTAFWPAVMVGSFLSNFQTGGPPVVVIGLTLASVLEAVFGGKIILKLTETSQQNRFGVYTDSLALIGASFISAALSASLGVLSLGVGEILKWSVFRQNWLTWLAANYLGGIIFVPIFLLLFNYNGKFRILDQFRFLLVFASGAGLCTFLYFNSGAEIFLFFLFPLLLLSAAVLSDFSSKLIVVLISLMALMAVRIGIGGYYLAMPFLMHIQLLLIGISTSSLFVSDFKREGSIRAPAVTLLGGWLISSLIFYFIHTTEVKKQKDAFIELSASAIHTIQGQMNANVVALRSGVGLFAASNSVERNEWREFVRELSLKENGSGLLGVSVAFRVPKNARSQFIKRISEKDGHPFKIIEFSKSRGLQDSYIVTYIEPELPNSRAIGLNLASEPTRKAAVEEATARGELSISDSLTLVQGYGPDRGFILFLPVYSHGPKPKSELERKNRVIAWISAPLRTQEFFDITMKNENFRKISYSVVETASGQVLASSADYKDLAAENEVKHDFSLGNKNYILYTKPNTGLRAVANSGSYWMGSVAIMLTLLLAAFVSYIQSAKHRANFLVEERTQQLENTGAIARLGGWEFDLGNNRLIWSKITCEIFGQAHECSPDFDSMTEFFKAGENRQQFLNKMNVCMKEGTSFDEELIINVNGFEISTRVIAKVEFRKNEVIRIVGTIQDISERVLLRNENSFIIESLQLAVWKYYPQTNALHWDKSMYNLYDFEPDDFGGHFEAWENSLSHEAKDEAIREMQLALLGTKEFNTTFKIKTKSGAPRYIGARGFVKRDEKNNPISMYGINWDRTKEYKLEEQLMFERAKTLHASKLASLGEMSAAIAHEINNPLAIIQGSVELLPRFIMDPVKFASRIETILKSIERISKIVNGLRKFSRSSEGYSYREESLNEIVKEAINLVSVKSQRFNTSIICDFQSETKIHCDMVEIEQVLVNLISNGIDAVKDLSDKWVKVVVSEDGPFVILKVVDSGTGIPEKYRDKLFEPFFTTKPVGEGTGLGLSITKGILEDHSATIVLDVNQQNTAFVIRFRKVVASEA